MSGGAGFLPSTVCQKPALENALESLKAFSYGCPIIILRQLSFQDLYC